MLALWSLWNRFTDRFSDEDGQTAVEYTLLLALVALAIILASPNLRNLVKNIFEKITSGLSSANA